ncbi:MAG: exo-alpha-sialidase [Armatimonadota bacterium]
MPAFRSELIFPPQTDRPSCHASTIAELSNRDLLCAWYAGQREGAPDVAILASRLPAGDEAWTAPEIIVDTPDQPEGNPVLFQAPDGRLLLFYVTIEWRSWQDCPLKLRASDDGGHTWGPERFLRRQHGWMTRNKPLVLDNGDLILPLYDESVWASLFGISSDGGESWQFTDLLRSQPGNIQPSVVQLTDGSLFALMRTGGHGGRLWQTRSRDRGRTWQEPAPSDLSNPNSAADVVRLPNGNLVLAFNNTATGRTPMSVALSRDEGRTWPLVRDLETGPGEYSYPAVITASDGLVHLTYTYRRESIKHVAFDEDWLIGV